MKTSIVIMTLLFLTSISTKAQVPTCDPEVPYYIVNLSGQPAGSWTSPAHSRLEQCCGVNSSENCTSFDVTLDSGAAMINLEIVAGNLPSGALFYQVNCDTPVYVGQPVCVVGSGPFHITFCKPGNNQNAYKITSISKPTFPADVTVRLGCTKTLGTLGFQASSVSWNSVFPGSSGAYNSYLSCTNCPSPDYTPDAGVPAYIDYRICGTPIASLCGYVAVCDTVRIYNVSALTASVTPVNAGFCAGGSVTLTASASGGAPPYTYIWKDQSNNQVGTGSTYVASTAGTFTLETRDAVYGPANCPPLFMSVPVLVTQPPIVNAGGDQSVCTSSPTAYLIGTAENATGGTWSGGAGTFSPNANSLIVAYTPSAGEISTGFVNLTLTSTGAGGGCVDASDVIKITYPPLLTVSLDSQSLSCHASTATLSPVAGGGIPSYIYSWSNNSANSSITVWAGNYCVVITDGLGCSATACADVTVPPLLVLNVTTTDATTIGGTDGTATATPSGGTLPYTYIWSPTSQTTQTATGLSYGIYYVTVEDANNCSLPASVIVNDPACNNLSASISSYVNILCHGNMTGSATVLATGGPSGVYTYNWNTSPVQNTATVTGLGAGTYLATVYDGSCGDIVSVVISEPSPITNSMNHTNVDIVGGNNGSAAANPLGGVSPYNYSWSNSATTQAISNLYGGTYSVTIQDANSCGYVDSVQILEPPCNNIVLNISTTDVSCYGGNDGTATAQMLFATAPFTYTWNTNPSQTTQTATGLSQSTYVVVVRDAKNCIAFKMITITKPSPLSIGLVKTDLLCSEDNNGTIDLTVSGGTYPYSYLWSNGIEVEDQVYLTSGTYSVTVTDSKGCSSTGSASLSRPPVLSSWDGKTDVTCNGGSDGSVDASASGGVLPYSYLWSNGATTEDISGLMSGQYVLVVTDANGCTPSVSLSILIDGPEIVRAEAITVDCPVPGSGVANVTVTPAGGNNGPYRFSYDGGTTYLPVGNYNALLQADSTYYLFVKDGNGCLSAGDTLNINPEVSIQDISFAKCFPGGTSSTSVIVSPAGGAGELYRVSFDDGITFANAGNYSDNLPIANSYNLVAKDSLECISASLPITIPDSLSLSIVTSSYPGGYNISCNGLSDGNINLSVSGGTTPYTYSWSNSGSTEDISVITAGTYTVLVTDVNGCTTANSITLTEPAVLSNTIAISSDYNGMNVSGNGASDGSIDLSVSGGTTPYAYSWSNSETTEDISGITAGTYTVLVADANGCTTANSITLTEPAVLSNTIVISSDFNGQNISCNGAGDGSIDLSVSGGTIPYTYSWSNSETTEDISGITAGTYTVLVADANGYTTTNSITLTEPAVLSNTIVISSDFNGQNISCNGESDGSIDLSVTGGTTNYAFSWSNSETTEDISGITAGTYTVLIADVNGCTTTNSITLTEPAVLSNTIAISSDYNGQNISCNGASDGSIDLSVTGGTTNYAFSWSNSETTEDISGITAGTYTVLVADVNGCTTTNTIAVSEPLALTGAIAVTSDYNGQNISCNGASDGSIDLTVAGGTTNYNYLWSNSETTEDMSGLSANTYSVLVTDVNGCTAIISLTVTQPAALAASIAVSSDYNGQDISCNGMNDGALDLSVTGGTANYIYSWSNSETVEDISGLIANTYAVLITDENGCTLNADITLTEPAVLSTSIAVSSDYNGQDISCNGMSDGSIDFSVAGGTAFYVYLWSNSATTEDISGLIADTYSVLVTDVNGCTAANSITLGNPPLLTSIAVITSDVSCNGGNNGSAVVGPSGGTIPYFFLWSNGQTTSAATGLSQATYSVTTTDINGCMASDFATITQPPALTDAMSIKNVLCNGGNTGIATATVTGGSGSYTYLWDNGQTDATATGLSLGTYYVTIMDGNGCTIYDFVFINQPAVLTDPIIVTDVLCQGGNTGTATAAADGGTLPYTFEWSNSQTTAMATGLSSGNYSVTITDFNGCTLVGSITVNEPAALSSDVNVTNVLCNGGSSATATVFISGGIAPYIYSWSNGNTISSLSGLSAGIYFVTTTDLNGCSVADTALVNEPFALFYSLSKTNVLCNGNNSGASTIYVNGGIMPYTYLWPNGETTSSVSGLGAGSYTATVTDFNGCNLSVFILITQPASLVHLMSSEGASCNGGSDGTGFVSVSGGVPPYTYLWGNTTNQTSSTATGLSAGNYSVTVSDNNNCSFTDDVLVTENSPVVLSFYARNSSCFESSNGQIDLSVIGGAIPYSYIWSSGDTSQDLSDLTEGTYFVTVLDANKCSATGNVVITKPDNIVISLSSPESSAGYNISEFNGTNGSINTVVTGGTPPYDFLWANGFTGQNPINLSAGSATVQVTDHAGCISTASITLLQPLELAMPNGISPNGDGKNDLFIVRGLDAFTNGSFQVFNRWGDKVYATTDYNNRWDGTNQKGDKLPDGTYYVILIVNDREIVLTGYVDIRK